MQRPSPVRGKLIALALSGDALPTEFRIFAAGVNESSKGPILFDEKAAAAVMAAYERSGVDVAIDLEHDSIDENARAARADAGDARGWCKLEVRPGPELWACGVTWTPDGARRLSDRTQRYISPVVRCSKGDRAAEIFNLALVSMPATFDAAPLVASVRQFSNGSPNMDPKLVKEAMDVLEAGDAKKALEILKGLLVSAAGGESAAADPAAGGEAMAEGPDAAAAAAGAPVPAKPKDQALSMALRRTLEVEDDAGVVASVKALKDEVGALRLEREADTRRERLELVGELVKLGVELPATAWENAEKRIPCKVLRAMPMPELRDRVEAFRKAPRTAQVASPAGDAQIFALSAAEEKAAEGLTPEQKARFIALRRNAKARQEQTNG